MKSYHETNLNAIAEGAWTLMVIDQDDRQTIAWAAGEIDRLRAERDAARAQLALVLDRAVSVPSEEPDESDVGWSIHLGRGEMAHARAALGMAATFAGPGGGG